MRNGSDEVAQEHTALMRVLVRSWEYRRPGFWGGVRFACGVFNVALGGILAVELASSDRAVSLSWVAALPLAGAVLIFWTVFRLQQQSLHRVGDLERSRTELLDDSTGRLRRIERDLHDGAQAQMVALTMKLGLAKDHLGKLAARTEQVELARILELVDSAYVGAKEATNELRDLARGIYPAVLNEGMGPALAALTARSDLPIELKVDLPERLPAAIETIVYFCVAELLTNVSKHSGARSATLEAVQLPGVLRIRIRDDGRGGARIEAGGGLAGLVERLRPVDGRLHINSPSGGPTVVVVELPSQV